MDRSIAVRWVAAVGLTVAVAGGLGFCGRRSAGPTTSGADPFIASREAFAARLQADLGSAFQVTAGGLNATTLGIRWERCGGGALEEFRRRGILADARREGFRTVACTWQGQIETSDL